MIDINNAILYRVAAIVGTLYMLLSAIREHDGSVWDWLTLAMLVATVATVLWVAYEDRRDRRDFERRYQEAANQLGITDPDPVVFDAQEKRDEVALMQLMRQANREQQPGGRA